MRVVLLSSALIAAAAVMALMAGNTIRPDSSGTRGSARVRDACDVAWVGANGAEPFWRGRITSIDYNFWH